MAETNYSRQAPGKIIDRIALHKRKKMFRIFLQEFPGHHTNSVLDVGVTADKRALSSNYFEQLYPVKSKIIALSNQDASHLETIYPGLIFKQGDARELPFTDQSVDVVFSSAVIEHIGSSNDQKRMLAECYRVAKQGVFITTPNRWFPIEVHTLLPFLHWLPKKMHRHLLKSLRLTFYANENNLNLVDRLTLTTMCNELSIPHFYFKSIQTCGLTSNLMLIIKK